jgi:hypothetical protein
VPNPRGIAVDRSHRVAKLVSVEEPFIRPCVVGDAVGMLCCSPTTSPSGIGPIDPGVHDIDRKGWVGLRHGTGLGLGPRRESFHDPQVDRQPAAERLMTAVSDRVVESKPSREMPGSQAIQRAPRLQS